MGWTYTHRPESDTDLAFFEREFCDYENSRNRILDLARVGSAVYIKMETTSPQGGDPLVYMLVCLTSWKRRDYYNFGYKDMDESCGPIESKAPLRMLTGLSEPSNEYARAWRERVRKYHEKRRRAPNLVEGTRFRLADPLHFSDGAQLSEFEVTTVPGRSGRRRRRTVYRSLENGGLYAISKIKERELTIIP